MKKIFSFLILLAIFIIGFFHSSMMIFAMQNSKSIDINNNSCTDACCIEQNIDHGVLTVNNNFFKKIFTIIINFDYLSINTVHSFSFGNKSLVSKTSPPYYERKIINYSYHTLIKIIKSNT